MKGRWIHFVAAYAAFAALGATVRADAPPPTLWSQQICSTMNVLDYTSGVAADGGGNVYVAGYTNGDLGGPNQGYSDAFIIKYDGAGTQQWIRQIGTNKNDSAAAIAVDGSGNNFITGHTDGLLGGSAYGGGDAFVIACDSGGTTQWSTQIGTGSRDEAHGIALDGSGNVYITGFTEGDLGGPNQGWSDAFLAKLDGSGTVQWTRQLGTSALDRAYAIAADAAGNSYIAGFTEGDLEGSNQGDKDVFVAKYDSGGTWQWTRQLGSSEQDLANDVATDGSGNIYLAGGTDGNLGGPNQGSEDAFLARLDSSGAVGWIRQLGGGDHVYYYYTDVAADSSGNAYVTGREEWRYSLAKYGSDGTQQWKRGTTGSTPSDVALDAGGNAYVTGNHWELADVIAVASYPATAGDANLDGCVDGLDYTVWSNLYKRSDMWWDHGDFTGEGDVDGLDYILWSNNYLVGCPASPGAVPEPSSALLLTLGVCALRRRRTGQRS